MHTVTNHLSRRPIISIDVESNGLYGQPFCVGAIELDWGGRILRQFLARCPLDEVEDGWMMENIWPKLKDVEETHESLELMERAFIEWFSMVITSRHKRNSKVKPIVLVDVGFPVDTRFLYAAFHRMSRDSRRSYGDAVKLSPYPLLDLGSILAGIGRDPDEDRRVLASWLREGAPPGEIRNGKLHHPIWDAETSALCLIKAIRMMEEGKTRVYGVGQEDRV